MVTPLALFVHKPPAYSSQKMLAIKVTGRSSFHCSYNLFFMQSSDCVNNIQLLCIVYHCMRIMETIRLYRTEKYTNLSIPVLPVGELQFCEADGVPHPLTAGGWGGGMEVDTRSTMTPYALRCRTPTLLPFPVEKPPSVGSAGRAIS